MKTAALILASGEGTRMSSLCEEYGLPKHLLPLPNGQTIIGRLAASLSSVCDEVVCTIKNEDDYQKFYDVLSPLCKSLKIIVKEESEVEYSEIPQAAKHLTSDNVVQTNGDLIFPDGVIEAFVSKHKNKNHFVRGREGNREQMSSPFDIFNSRISIIPAPDARRFSPSHKLFVIKSLTISLLLGRVDKIPTLFNVDTPEIYDQAKKYFS